jgi:hypothetical protein
MSIVVPLTALASMPPPVWAEHTFGTAALGDARRTQRLVATAAACAACPDGSLPQQLHDPAALKATYRLLDNAQIDFAALLAPHQAQTEALAASLPVVLLVQDTTELDFSAHQATTDLAPIGDGRGRGFHLQTVLAVQPQPRLPLGVLAAEPWRRQPAPVPDESSFQRTKRPRESAVWGRLVEQVGSPPAGVRWVHVADRGADCYSFFAACARTETDVLVRVVQNRRIADGTGEPGYLRDGLRAQPARSERALHLPTRAGRPARQTTVAISWTAVTLQPPVHRSREPSALPPLPVWTVRVWEAEPPSDSEPVEWLLMTSVPVECEADAWERVDWYTTRWLIEEFHQCLKTGCKAESCQLRDRANLWRHLGILLPLAVRLLLLRDLCRAQPTAPATLVADPLTIQLVAARTRLPPAQSVLAFTRQVARLGGHQGRKGDGPPGWRTLWRGWLFVQTLLEGARLAADLEDA